MANKMHKTSKSYCKNCIHCTTEGGNGKICNYYLDTGELRNCEVGYCDKKEVGKRPKKKNINNWGWIHFEI